MGKEKLWIVEFIWRAWGPRHASVGQRPLTELLKLRSTISDFDVILVGAFCHLTLVGHDVYLVGGCVRDLILKQTPKDFDIITSADLKEVTFISYFISILIFKLFYKIPKDLFWCCYWSMIFLPILHLLFLFFYTF